MPVKEKTKSNKQRCLQQGLRKFISTLMSFCYNYHHYFMRMYVLDMQIIHTNNFTKACARSL